MANGRFLSKTIAVSTQLARVSDLAELLFYRMLAHADRDGRLEGDPLLVKATCAPLKASLSLELIPALLAELAQTSDPDGEPLIRWYAVKGRPVVQFPGFDRHQTGMRKDREAASRLPAFDSDALPLPPPTKTVASGLAPQRRRPRSGVGPELVRSRTGEGPERLPPKVSEVQGEVEVQVEEKIPAASAAWAARFAEAYEVVGERSVGEIGGQLKPVIRKYGEPRVWEAWDWYIRLAPFTKFGEITETRDTARMSPADFVKNFATWDAKSHPVGVNGGRHAPTAS